MIDITKKISLINFTDKNNTGRIKYIVIHYFGSLGSAKSVANYFYGGSRKASAHYAVDNDSIYQCVEDGDIAWHCGARSYVHPYCRNSNSIGIEVRPYKIDTSTSGSSSARDWYFTDETIKNTVELTKYLMEKYNVPIENVIRHYDVTGKWCPRPYMGDDINLYYGVSGNQKWTEFLNLIENNNVVNGDELDMTKEELLNVAGTGDTPSSWAQEATEKMKSLGVFNGDGQGNYGWQQPITREAVAVILANFMEKMGM